MQRRFCRLLVLLFFIAITENLSAQVYLIPTIHGLHKTNQHYNYDSLKQSVKSFKPDLILVEIRDEDLKFDSAYLASNYPFEMRMMQAWFPHKEVRGFDWLGNDIEGKKIPVDYWKTIAPIKRWEKELNADSNYMKRLAGCDQFTELRMNILVSGSLNQILGSNDRQLTLEYYKCMNEILKGTIHERILQFYDLRNQKMLDNIKRIINENKNKKIVILTGDDHFAYLDEKIN